MCGYDGYVNENIDSQKGLEKRMGRRQIKLSTVDEVEVPHCKVGANRITGKVERSADASQGYHTLILSPFGKQYVKLDRATV